MNKEKPKIFLSYAHEDIGMAKKIFDDLKRFNLDVWLDYESLKPGQKWKDKILEAIENSNYFLFLLSHQSLNKRGFVQKEFKFALEVLEEFPDDKEYIIPVRLDDCKPKNRRLKDIQWTNLFPECEYEKGLMKILNTDFHCNKRVKYY